MALEALRNLLNDELDALTGHLRAFVTERPLLDAASHFTVPDECFLEGLLSRVWQAWCGFCRGCVIESCVGTITSTGALLAPLPCATSEWHVSGAAIRAMRKSTPPYWGGHNTAFHAEPTWGDVDILVKIISRLQPSNSAQLLPAFSSCSSSAKALQRIRNGSAHLNDQTYHDVQSLRSGYVVFPIGHPTHAMFWIEPNSKDFLITHAVDELKDAAIAAVS